MNKRIRNKLSSNILERYTNNNCTFKGLEFNRPETKVVAGLREKHHQQRLLSQTKETWEERVNRIDSYKFANPTPIKVHKSPTLWDRLRDKIGGWLKWMVR